MRLEARDGHRRLALVDVVEPVLLGGLEVHLEAVDLVHELAALHGRRAHQDGEDDLDDDDRDGGDEAGVEAEVGGEAERRAEDVDGDDGDPDEAEELPRCRRPPLPVMRRR